MKTSIIDIPEMLSVLTVDEVEKRFGEMPGVESATVNYAAKNATVRFDETLLEVADIKVLVHQRGQQSTGQSKPGDDSASESIHQSEDEPEHQHADAPMPDAASGAASPPESAAPKAAMPSPTTPSIEGQGAKPQPSATAPPATPGA